MSRLTVVSERVKKWTLYLILIIIASAVLKISFSIVGAINTAIINSRPILADKAFGILPPIQINSVIRLNTSASTFEINTPSGVLPEVKSSVVTVYSYTQSTQTLLSSTKATHVAQSLGFKNSPISTSNNVYVWVNGYKKLFYNIQNNQFKITNSNYYAQIQSDITTNKIADHSFGIDGIKKTTTDILRSLPISLTTDFDVSKPTVILLKYSSNGTSKVVDDPLQANAIKIVFNRNYQDQKLDQYRTLSDSKLPLLTDNPLDGNLSFTLDTNGSDGNIGLLDLNFNDWIINTSSYSTYNLKTPTQAWEDVKIGQAYLVSLFKDGNSPFDPYKELKVKTFQIQDISLAYFDGVSQQSFLQPIYVLTGKAVLQDGTFATFYFYDIASN